MKSTVSAVLLLAFVSMTAGQNADAAEMRRLPLAEYIDKVKAGWVGQMVGVGWGGPTEFKYKAEIIPTEEMPAWQPTMVNQFGQDDLYVEMTFLHTLEEHGLEVSSHQAGLDFALTRYPLWHANDAARWNLRTGIAPPDSGHPVFNKHADDIDYQIEADFAGLIAPGMANTAIELGEKFGSIMNYGDGLYGGQFIAGMYCETFFETDPEKIIRAGLACIPTRSQYHECISDVLEWYEENPEDWQKTWRLVNDKYHNNPEYRRFSCTTEDNFNIDAKINGAYVVIGLLYGKRDPDRTITIATRCGQDSDCNPSSAAGVLFTTIGFSNLPKRFTSALDTNTKFSHTAYDFDRLIKVCEGLARKAVTRAGGKVEMGPDDKEAFVIPRLEPMPGALEQCFDPGPITGSRYSEQEMAQIDDELKPEKQPLFNGKDFSGWHRFVPDDNTDPVSVWGIESGVLRCTGTPAGYIRTEEDYSDYKLHVQWRWPDGGGNSGILVHMSSPDRVWPRSIESQLMAGNAGDFYVIGGTDFKQHLAVAGRRVPKFRASSEKSLGEWNTAEIYCIGDSIIVYVNNVLQNCATETTVTSGKICLQSEGKPIEFRKIYVQSLK